MKLAPPFLSCTAAHDIDHVDAREQLLDERLGIDTARIFPMAGRGQAVQTKDPAAAAPVHRRGAFQVCQPGAL